MAKKNEKQTNEEQEEVKFENNVNHEDNCSCGCHEGGCCSPECECCDDCYNGDECFCGDHCECGCCEECEDAEKDYYSALESKVNEYIRAAQVLQADFDNYRKRAEESIKQARLDGMIDAIVKILPALDSFKNAKTMITDEKVLDGIVMIENQILQSLNSLGVEKIEAVGQKFDPKIHNALAVVKDPNFDDDIVKEEYQAGYKLNDKIIRHSQVIVNKKED